jgi:hypothetical protein
MDRSIYQSPIYRILNFKTLSEMDDFSLGIDVVPKQNKTLILPPQLIRSDSNIIKELFKSESYINLSPPRPSNHDYIDEWADPSDDTFTNEQPYNQSKSIIKVHEIQGSPI